MTFLNLLINLLIKFSICKSDKMHLKNNSQLWRPWGITLGTKLKMPIFTIYLPHNFESRTLVFQMFMY